jgi:hypothetical protein
VGAVVVVVGVGDPGETVPAEFAPPPPPEQAAAEKAASDVMSHTKVRNFRVVIGLPVWEMWGCIFHKNCFHRPAGTADCEVGRLTMRTRRLLIFGGMLKFAENFLK